MWYYKLKLLNNYSLFIKKYIILIIHFIVWFNTSNWLVS